eukprot:TCONS_00012741-protein
MMVAGLRFSLIVYITAAFYLHFVAGNCKRTIFIDDDESPDDCTQKGSSFTCGSLHAAFGVVKDGDCISLTNTTTLQSPIQKDNIKNVTIFSRTENTNVFCSNQSGLIFSKSSHVIFENITFNDCGMISSIDWNQGLLNISSAIAFIQCDNVNIKSTHLSLSAGYGFAFVDSNVFLRESSVVKSAFVNVSHENEYYAIGGGVLITFQSSFKGSNQEINIESSLFKDNFNTAKTSLGSSMYDDLPFGRGAGVYFLSGPNTENNAFIANNVIVSGNEANIGAGIYISFAENTKNNSFSFINCQIKNNHAQTAAGGALGLTSSEIRNHIHFKNSIFSNNTAQIGGGIAFVWPDTYDDAKQIGIFMLENITVDSNQAKVGGAFHFQNVFVVLQNVKIVNTNNIDLPGKGSFYALRSELRFIGNDNIIYNNRGSAIVIDNSQMTANGSIVFRQNFGDTGGALALYEHSRLILTQNSQLLFENNTAYMEGGAIYAPTAGPPMRPWNTTELNIYECFIKFDGISYLNFQGNVTFQNNDCNDGDSDDIFISSVQPCRHFNENQTQVFSSWPNFHFPSEKSSIASNAICMWTLKRNEWYSYPGKLLNPHIVLQDDRGNNVSESMDVKIYPKGEVVIDTNNAFVTSDKDSIKLQLKQKTKDPIAFNITVKTTSNLFLEQNLTNLHFKGCPFGYTFDQHTGMCECDIMNNQNLNIAFCDSEYIFLQKNVWVNPSQTKTYTCPNEYCHNDEGRFNHYNNDWQCAQYRQQNSTLCSKCKVGFSAVSGSYDCQECPKNSKGWIGITAILFFTLLLFVLLVFALGVDIMSYNLNICIYSYEVIGSLYTSEQTIDVILSFVMSIFQVSDRNSIYPTMCLWYGMTALGKMSMGFIVPIVMLFWMAVLYVICIKFKQEIFINNTQYNLKDRCYKTMSIIVVMCFSDLLRISIQILHYIQIDGTKYVYMYADEKWFGPKHQPHAIVAAIVILFLVLFSIAQIVLLRKSNVTVFVWLRKFEDNSSVS